MEGEDIPRPEILMSFWKSEENVGNMLSLADEQKSNIAHGKRLTREKRV